MGKPWTPIGTKEKMFTGTFDGSGKTISNLTINEGGYIGLFGVVGNSTIKNIKLASTNISGTERVGALIGRISGNANVSNVTVDEKSSVAGTKSNTGGIIGCAAGEYKVILKNLTNNAAVKNSQSSTARAAGIIGQVTSGANISIEGCVNNGAIEATDGYPGGILSALQGSSDVVFTNCKNTGTLTGKYKGHMIAWLCNGARVTINEYAEDIHDDVIGAIFLGEGDDYFYHIWINEKEIFVNKLKDVTDNKLEKGAILFNDLYKDKGELSKKALDRAIGFYTYIKDNRPNWKIDYTSYWKIFTAYSTFGGDGWPQCLTEYNKHAFEDESDYLKIDELEAIGTQRRAKNLIKIGE